MPEYQTNEQVLERLAPFRANLNDAGRAFFLGMLPTTTDPSLVERLNCQIANTRRDVALGSLESAWNFGRNTLAILHKLRIPVVAINPAEPQTDVESMRREGVEVTLMCGVGHFLMMESPARFNELFAATVHRLWTLHGNAEPASGVDRAQLNG